MLILLINHDIIFYHKIILININFSTFINCILHINFLIQFFNDYIYKIKIITITFIKIHKKYNLIISYYFYFKR